MLLRLLTRSRAPAGLVLAAFLSLVAASPLCGAAWAGAKAELRPEATADSGKDSKDVKDSNTAARPVVVELYTSEGCSSCLAADALLTKLAERKDVLALDLHVTYWDMFGWTDSLGKQSCTERQKAYAQAMGRGGVYTPQMVVDGLKDLVGGREDAIDKAIARRETALPAVPVSLSFSPGEIHLTVAAARDKPAQDATIWLFAVKPRATVKIGAGENAGHSMAYRNVVTAVKAVGIWKGKKISLDLPRQAAGGGLEDSLAVVVQQGGHGAVLGATPLIPPPATAP